MALDLDNNNIGADGARALAAIDECATLTALAKTTAFSSGGRTGARGGSAQGATLMARSGPRIEEQHRR
jgi:hypothetical protein